MPEGFFRCTEWGPKPADDATAEAMKPYLGKTIRMKWAAPRNVGHHNKFFALLNTVFPHQSVYPTFDTFRDAVSVALGYGDTVKLGDGRTIICAKSISFAKMDQVAFGEFYDRAVNLILTKILPHVDRADLEQQVHDILDGRSAA